MTPPDERAFQRRAQAVSERRTEIAQCALDDTVPAAVRRPRRPLSVPCAYGVRLTPNWHDATFWLYLTGLYGRALARLLARRTEPFVFVDIGANQGLYSLLAARNPACQQVLALEPVLETHAILRRNIRINDAGSRIRALRWAISDRRGSADIARRPHHSGGATLDRLGGDGTLQERVELHPFSDLAAELRSPDLPLFVKIDVEGHELAVLRSIAAAASLHPYIDDVFYEVDQRWVDADALRQALDEMGIDAHRDVVNRRHRDVHAWRSQPRGT